MAKLVASSFYSGALPAPMERPADTPELNVIAEYVRRGRCVLFVRAGLSAAAGLPDWQRLMRSLIERATPYAIAPGIVPPHFDITDDAASIAADRLLARVRRALGAKYDELQRGVGRELTKRSAALAHMRTLEIVGRQSLERGELLRLLEGKRYPEVTSRIRQALGERDFQHAIAQLLTPAHGIPPIHRQLVRTPWASVVTTNFDDLLERAYDTFAALGRPRAPTGVDLSSLGTLLVDAGFFILKAHGDLTRPEALVFSAEDYRRVIHESPAFQATISSILMTHAVLFVGYSLSDVNFRLLLDAQLSVFRGHVPPRFALLSGVDEVERDILWRTARLRVLSYPAGEHQEVERFLTALGDAFAPAPVARRPSRARPRRVTPASRAEVGVRRYDDQLALTLTYARAQQTWFCSPSPRQLHDLFDTTLAAIRAHASVWDATRHVQRVTRRLASFLPADFVQALGALPSGTALRFSCRDGTHRIPWEWVGRAGKPLAARLALSRASAVLSDEARGRRRLGRGGGALIIGDAGSATGTLDHRLDGAEREADGAVAALTPIYGADRVVRLSRAGATHAAVMEALASRQWDIVHLAGHAWFDDVESYFYSWDSLLLGSELTPLLSARPPALVVMSTHYTSYRPTGWDQSLEELAMRRPRTASALAGEDVSGFAEVAMRCGVGAFVGCFGEPPDATTPLLTERFYRELVSGRTVAQSLLAARRALLRRHLSSALMFTVTGDGELVME